MGNKIGPNEPCPCGSGKKHKKCCGAVGANAFADGASYDRSDRDAAGAMIGKLVDDALFSSAHVEEVDYEAEEEGETEEHGSSLEEQFWGDYVGERFPKALLDNAKSVFEAWVAFDLRQRSGERLVDRLLQRKSLRAGQRAFLEGMKQSVMKPYAVVEVQPNKSLTLRDLVDDTITVVHDPAARPMKPADAILIARIVSCGVSGKAEREGGAFVLPEFLLPFLIDKIRENRSLYLLRYPDRSTLDADKEMPPFFNLLWLKTYTALTRELSDDEEGPDGEPSAP